MTFGEKLKAARNEAGLKQSELAKQLKTTANTISNWENNVSKPDLDALAYICGILHVRASYFLQPAIPEDEVSISELNFIKKYRSLDASGKEHVNTIMQWESDRSDQIAGLEEQIGRTGSRAYSDAELRAMSVEDKVDLYRQELEREEKAKAESVAS